MSQQDGGSAFPQSKDEGSNGTGFPIILNVGGMTLRDYFAAKAMAALIVDPARADQSRDECARLSYLMADAMLKAREAGK